MASTVKHRHHVVSRFYLRRFADSRDMIMRVPYDGSKPRAIGTRDATVQSNFYRLQAEGRKPDEFENALSGVEEHAALAFSRLLEKQVWPISVGDRVHISAWVALQFLRSQATRASGEEIARSMSKLQVGVATTQQLREGLMIPPDKTDLEVEEVRAKTLSTAETRSVNTIHHLRLIGNSLPGITNLVYQRRPWILITWTRRTISTSDTPVFLVPEKHDQGLGIGTGVGTASEIIVPVGRRAALTFGELGGSLDDFRTPGSTFLAKTINRYTLLNGRREAFHHPEDDPFAGLDIPDVRRSEIHPSASEQINELINAFAKQRSG